MPLIKEPKSIAKNPRPINPYDMAIPTFAAILVASL
jgi:hypothetical protein